MIQNSELMPENEVKFAPEGMQNNKPKFQDGQIVKIAGIITSIKKKYTKNNKIMAFVTIEDLYGQVEIIIFENAYLSAQNSLIEENIILVEGRLSIREDEETKIVANKICDFEVKKKKALSVDITNLTDEVKLKLKGLIKFFNGDKNNLPMFVNVNGELKPCGQIYCNDEILQIFKQIIGNENIHIIEL